MHMLLPPPSPSTPSSPQPSIPFPAMQPVYLLDLPEELIYYILLHLDISDLLQVSRTSRTLRALSLDPILHQHRRRHASHSLSHLLHHRPNKTAISPPQAWIFLSKTNVLSRSISKSLIKIRLNHSLNHRPSVDVLVDRAILPSACANRALSISPIILRQQESVTKSQLRDRLGRKLERRPSVRSLVALNIIPQECVRSDGQGKGRSWVSGSPRLVEARRRVIRENLKDGLRAWVERRGWREQKRREGQWEDEGEGVRSVKHLVRKMTARIVKEGAEIDRVDRVSLEKTRAQARWGRDVEVQRRKEERRRAVMGSQEAGGDLSGEPTRAHVLGLRRFWEGVTKAASIS